MPMFRTTRRVAHSPERMYALVADVERYPEFLPLCEGLVIRRRETRADGTELLIATMSVGYKAIKESFTSRVTLFPAEQRILVEYIDGPFRHLENRWNFRPAGEGGCEIEFFISYEFASKMLGLVMGTMFDRAFRTFAEAFEKRADALYGRASASPSISSAR